MDVPRSSDARTPERIAYDQWHAWQGVEAEPDAIWHRMVIRHLLPARDLGGRRVLEMACGRGGFSYWLATQVLRPRQLVSADFSQVAVDKGASFAARHDVQIGFEVCDITRLAHSDAAFDTVISCETIEHVPEPRQAIAELARVLAPGGRLFLTTPSYFNLLGPYYVGVRAMGRPFSENGQPINHLLILPRTLHWIRRAGLRVTAVDGVGHYVPFPGAPPRRLRMLDAARPLTKWFALHSLVVAERVQ